MLDKTMEQVRGMRALGQAHVGGLGGYSSSSPQTPWSSSRHYGVWACVRDWNPLHQVACGAGDGMLACFQYDEESQQFSFWGMNQHVRMVPPYRAFDQVAANPGGF
mmetsp:Transcript_56239/g.133565  ORF Transcript_56239/g.133565 Transcript_56239/m.133565 type:complete len:106 (-) Transcript_56239:194-511(-)